MESITYAPGGNASTRKSNRISHSSPAQGISHLRGVAADPRHTQHAAQLPLEEPESNTLLIEDATLSRGFVLLPKLVLYARNLSRDAKLLYAILLGYAWQEDHCFPGYTRLCADLDASENAVRKWMRELETAHVLSQRRRGLGLSNLYTLHDLRTAKIEVQEPHKTKVQEPHKTEGLEPQKSHDYEETREIQTEERKHRTIGERPIFKIQETAEQDERALGGGQPAVPARVAPLGTRSLKTGKQPTNASGARIGEKDATPRNQALVQARAVARAVIEEHLRGLGGSNPAGGAETILHALVDVGTPAEHMAEVLAIGVKRLEQQQELSSIPNPTGYLIGIMRNLAVEAWLRGWDLEEIRVEDEEKHAQAVRAAHRGEARAVICESETCPATEEALPAVDEAVLTDLPTLSDPASYLPDGVQAAHLATVATWQDHLPDPETSQPRAVSMLWGFVRDAISGSLNLARRSQLDALTPKWDATRPRTLLLVCDTAWATRAVELHLRREIEPQLGKLLSRFFDSMQVVYVPACEQAEDTEEGYQ